MSVDSTAATHLIDESIAFLSKQFPKKHATKNRDELKILIAEFFRHINTEDLLISATFHSCIPYMYVYTVRPTRTGTTTTYECIDTAL